MNSVTVHWSYGGLSSRRVTINYITSLITECRSAANLAKQPHKLQDRIFSAAKLRKPTKTKWMASASHGNRL